jgi:hypothetical protein
MENNNTILDELKDISLVVASIGNRNAYTVPQGYFDGLAVEVMLRIAIEEKAGNDPVLNVNKDNIYQAPEGYFDSLAGNILNRIKAQETGNAKEELELLSPLLGQIGKKTPFTSPEGYFNDFSDNIVAGVKAIEFVNEELENLSPTMLSLKNKQVYEVPEGYFDTSAAVILDKAKQQQPAKVISIGFGRKIMRYAAAAMVTGIIVISGYVISNKPGKIDGTVASAKTGLDSIGLAKITDPEIESFLNNNTASVADTTIITTNDDINDNDSKDLLANISDEELQQYAKDQHLETPLTN